MALNISDTVAIQLLSAATGLVGTVGGVLISYLTLRHTFLKDRHTVKVEMAKSMLVWPQPGTVKPNIQKDQLTFSVANTGAKEFTLVSVGIKIGRRTAGMYINDPLGTVKLPYKLKPDETCSFWSDYKQLVKDIKKPRLYNKIKIRGYVKDYIGNTFYSNKMTIVLKETKRDKLWGMVKDKYRSILTTLLP